MMLSIVGRKITILVRILLELLKKYPRTVGTVHSPPSEGWQAQPDGVVVSYLQDLYIHSPDLWKPKP